MVEVRMTAQRLVVHSRAQIVAVRSRRVRGYHWTEVTEDVYSMPDTVKYTIAIDKLTNTIGSINRQYELKLENDFLISLTGSVQYVWVEFDETGPFGS